MTDKEWKDFVAVLPNYLDHVDDSVQLVPVGKQAFGIQLTIGRGVSKTLHARPKGEAELLARKLKVDAFLATIGIEPDKGNAYDILGDRGSLMPWRDVAKMIVQKAFQRTIES
jgi:hypothetical protein